jgi:hypothetical protein
MSTVNLTNSDPIPLTAVVTAIIGGGYSVAVYYSSDVADDIIDSFTTIPSTVIVNVTSTTVPAGYHLGATGDGSWTLNNASSISGAFGASGSALEGSFTVVLYSGSQVVARHDPRLTIKSISGM